MRIMFCALLALCMYDAVIADDKNTRSAAIQGYMKAQSFSTGTFDVLNKSLDPKSRKYIEKKFIVEGRYIFAGHGLQHEWTEKNTGEWFGTVITTFDPDTNQLTTRYYSRSKTDWSVNTGEALELDEAVGQTVLIEGKDAFGNYIATHTTSQTHNGFTYRHLRTYPGIEPIQVDGFTAIRIK